MSCRGDFNHGIVVHTPCAAIVNVSAPSQPDELWHRVFTGALQKPMCQTRLEAREVLLTLAQRTKLPAT